MAGTAELMARLQQLEDGYYGDKEAARQQKFFDSYGNRFSNNRGLGLAILNELDARGVDTSAADEAVQQILDQLRTECNEILEAIKETQQTAIEEMKKVEEISNVVSEAVAANPAADTIDTSGLEAGEMPPPAETPALDAMDPNGEFNPDEVPPEETAEEVPPEEIPPEEVPPEATEEVPPQATGPNTELSDARMKRIKSRLSSVRASRNSYKPSAGILAAAQGGLQ